MLSFSPKILQPMPKIDHNGPSFKYQLRYKRVVDTDWMTEDISDPTRFRFVETRPVNIYEPYNITITAINNDGPSTTEPPMIIGYSGEASKLTFLKFGSSS